MKKLLLTGLILFAGCMPTLVNRQPKEPPQPEDRSPAALLDSALTTEKAVKDDLEKTARKPVEKQVLATPDIKEKKDASTRSMHSKSKTVKRQVKTATWDADADQPADAVEEAVERPELPIKDDVKIEFLDFKNTDIRDVVRAIAGTYRINVWMAPDVKRNVTVNFNNIPVKDAMTFLILENGFDYTIDHSVIKIFKPKEKKEKPKPKAPLTITYDDSLITFDLKEADLEQVVRKLSVLAGENIVLDRAATGTISGFIRDVPFEEGVSLLMENNGYVFRKVKNVYRIEKMPEFSGGKGRSGGGRMLAVTVEDNMVTMDVFNASIHNILQEISRQSGIDIFVYGRVEGTLSARCEALTVDGALDYLFRGTDYIFTKKDGIYFVGQKDIKGITSTELIRLNHMKAEGIIEMLPDAITSKATLKVIKEHNGIIAIGSYDIIKELKDFIGQIDQPVPQVLIEAIVVDFKTDKIRSVGAEMFLKDITDTSEADAGITRQFFPVLNTILKADEANKNIAKLEKFFKIDRIGRLPKNFFMTLNALEQQDLAKVISRPQIATLNGHTASITVGTTQYFLLKKESSTPTSGTTTTQTTEEFKTIQADISLQVTPWVSAAGEITTEISPSFSTPRQSLDPSTPPTIDRRELSSTVRLRDGETIILGGLIRTTQDRGFKEFPFLARIPFIGKFFRTETTSKNQSELIVYLTPHLYYGGEAAVDVEKLRID